MTEVHRVFERVALKRRSRDVTLQQVAGSTKITIRYLQAIEAGRFEQLPGGVYNISYIRQYARAVSADEQELLDAYRRHMHREDPAPRNPRGQAHCIGRALPACRGAARHLLGTLRRYLQAQRA